MARTKKRRKRTRTREEGRKQWFAARFETRWIEGGKV
jgi:hypothetical protein